MFLVLRRHRLASNHAGTASDALRLGAADCGALPGTSDCRALPAGSSEARALPAKEGRALPDGTSEARALSAGTVPAAAPDFVFKAESMDVNMPMNEAKLASAVITYIAPGPAD